MKYLITGHNGFKGTWLSLWLTALGHEVHGLSLTQIDDSLAAAVSLGEHIASERVLDVRETSPVHDVVNELQPDAVIHLAAQAIVKDSYEEPRYTFDTNVMGTLNILEATQTASSVRALLVVTSDKVYRPEYSDEGFTEDSPLGGNDPYSASKAMAELLVHSWTASFGAVRCPTATGRAGNVIGGGDHHAGRILPDIVNAIESQSPLKVRNPSAVRPWQHALDVAHGYTLLVNAMIEQNASGPWNFGPPAGSIASVREIIAIAERLSGRQLKCVFPDTSFSENPKLILNSGKARTTLGWKSALSVDASVGWTLSWHEAVSTGTGPYDATTGQIERYRDLVEEL